jgi:hypothetical protein
MHSLIPVLSLVMLVGCSDEVVTRFATLREASSQGAFGRGWLPPVLPDSATSIVERNNLDLNVGSGSFSYDLSERPGYVASLIRAGADVRSGAGGDTLSVISNGFRWEIWLPGMLGRAEWTMRQP